MNPKNKIQKQIAELALNNNHSLTRCQEVKKIEKIASK
jgi:hypothetical protein